MKYLAHIEKDIDSKIVSIQDVKAGLNSKIPQYWEKKEFFSLWRLEPMKAVLNTKSRAPHFAYKKGGGNISGGVGESIEHQFSKKVIFDKKMLNIKIGETQDILYFSEVLIEKPFEDGEYRADLYAKIKEKNKFNFPIDSFLIIELHKTNKVTKTKRQYFRDMNYASIEIDIWDKIKYEGNLNLLEKQLIGYFGKLRFAQFLHNPNYIEYQQGKFVKRDEKKRLPERKIEDKMKFGYANIEQVKAVEYHAPQKLSVQTMDENEFDIKQTKSLWNKLLEFFRLAK